jgi:hypothetical protein
LIMTEDFLHYLWKFRLAGEKLWSVTGEELVVLSPGEHNPDAGPDFLNARIVLGGTTWAGNVEIHVRSSDWRRHRHEKDPAYDNIILHAVYEHDLEIQRKNGEAIPTLLMKDFCESEAYDTYNHFLNNHLWVPCANHLQEVRKVVINDWLASLSVARLERKCTELNKLLEYNSGDWQQSFFEALSSTLGFRINKLPFEQVARQTPVQHLLRHKDQLFQVEAMLFGQAGLLEGRYHDDYPKKLKKEYLHLKNKFSLEPVPGHLWKFLRIRPNNFPTIRLAQMAMLLHLHSNLVGEILETPDPDQLRAIFALGVSDYWKSHYYFDRPSNAHGKSMSASTVDLIMINNVIPFLFLYGELKNKPVLKEKAVNLLEEIMPETNSVTRGFAMFGIRAESAANSQALLELKSSYCDQKKCLQCRIGLELIK